MAKEKIVGIYKITNKKNRKVYVGSSVDVHYRLLAHRSALKRQAHSSVLLQQDFDKHGITSFKFELIEKCVENNIKSRELYYINLFDCLNPQKGYNTKIGSNDNENRFALSGHVEKKSYLIAKKWGNKKSIFLSEAILLYEKQRLSV